MSIRDGLSRNRRVYERRARQIEQPAQPLLPPQPSTTWDEPQAFAPISSPEFFAAPQQALPAVSFSLSAPPPGQAEADPAQSLLRALGEENRFVSQNLHGEDS